jgi:hypothetical protein
MSCKDTDLIEFLVSGRGGEVLNFELREANTLKQACARYSALCAIYFFAHNLSNRR